MVVARNIVEEHIREIFERAWSEVVGSLEDLEYEILIWGSATEDNRRATDLDLIFRYEESSISSDKEDSIGGYLESETYTEYFTKIDPLIAQYDTVPTIVHSSRVSKVYRVDDESWINMSNNVQD
jgi:hypothetical protein